MPNIGEVMPDMPSVAGLMPSPVYAPVDDAIDVGTDVPPAYCIGDRPPMLPPDAPGMPKAAGIAHDGITGTSPTIGEEPVGPAVGLKPSDGVGNPGDSMFGAGGGAGIDGAPAKVGVPAIDDAPANICGAIGKPAVLKLGSGKPLTPLTFRPGAFGGKLGAPSGGAVAGSNGDIV